VDHRPTLPGTEPIGKIGPAPKASTPVNRTPSPAPEPAVESLAPKAPRDIGIDDPRWALAVQTRSRLQGAILRPYDRAILLKLGQTLGLNPFQANLVITVTQDQARRGKGPEDAISSLSMIDPPAINHAKKPSARNILLICCLTLLLEMIVILAMM
jgi:hypothetical protein